MRGALGFFGAVLAGAVLAHLAFSASVSAWIADRYSHRLFNVRNIDDPKEWGPLTRLFVEGQGLDDPRPKVLMFGSSVTWGYSWSENDVFSWHMQNTLDDYQVLNVAIIGEDTQAIIDLTCKMRGIRTEIAVTTVELNLFNMHLDDNPDDLTDCENELTYIALGGLFNYLHYTLMHPWGVEYFRVFWNQYDYPQPEQPFVWVPLADAYFPRLPEFLSRRARAHDLITSAIVGARNLSKGTLVFVAPTLREGLELSQYDAAHLEFIASIVIDICKESGQVVCLDPGLDLPREHFTNLTHLNLLGHREFADWILPPLPVHRLRSDH